MSEINFYAATTGDDPELDTLLIRLHTESACRTGGALALRPRDLNQDQCLIYLREKEGTARWQPVSRTLMNALIEHAEQRGATGDPMVSCRGTETANPSPTAATMTYVKATVHDVATALSALTGEPHPLAA